MTRLLWACLEEAHAGAAATQASEQEEGVAVAPEPERCMCTSAMLHCRPSSGKAKVPFKRQTAMTRRSGQEWAASMGSSHSGMPHNPRSSA